MSEALRKSLHEIENRVKKKESSRVILAGIWNSKLVFPANNDITRGAAGVVKTATITDVKIHPSTDKIPFPDSV